MARTSSPPPSAAAKPSSTSAARVVRRSADAGATKRTGDDQRPDGAPRERVSGLHLLRGLVAENLVLRREVAELRLLTAGACHDPMTGLGNRRFLRQRLAEELSRSQRRSEHAGVLVLVRVADLRTLARGANRRACLEAIQALAQGFRTTLRVADICCRVGFGSFGLLLPDTDGPGGARVVRRLRAAAMRVSARAPVPVSVAFGVAFWPEHGLTAGRLWSRAEEVLLGESTGRAHGGEAAVHSDGDQAGRRPGRKRLKVIRGGLASG